MENTELNIEDIIGYIQNLGSDEAEELKSFLNNNDDDYDIAEDDNDEDDMTDYQQSLSFKNADNTPFDWMSYNKNFDANLQYQKTLINQTKEDYVRANNPNLTIAESHNNPANIKYEKWLSKYGAVPGKLATDGGYFAVFPNMEIGLKAREDLLRGSFYKNRKVNDAMQLWSNKGYNGNIYPEISNKIMANLTPEEFQELTKRQLQHEDHKLAAKLGFMQYGGYIPTKYKLKY